MTNLEKCVASRALRYICCENMEREAAIARAKRDYGVNEGDISMAPINSCLNATMTVPEAS